MRSPRRLLQPILDIREQEFGRLLLMSTYLLVVIACYTTTKAVRDSLFVTRIGPSQLPYVYLLIAGAMGVVSYFYSKAVNRIGLYRLIRLTSLIAMSHLLVFWGISNHNAAWFYVLYVWVSLFGAITASQVWLLATHVFDPREAKRAFPWIGVGAILGGMLGGALTKVVAPRFGTETLLPVCAVLMCLTLVFLQRAERFTHTPRSRETGANAATLFGQVRGSRHLTMMVILLSVAVVVEAFVDYEYKFVSKQSFHSKDQLTAFFGMLSFYIGVFSLVFQMFVSSRILKRFGVGWAILLLPAGLLGAAVTLALWPTLWAAAALQLIDGGFSYSIHRSGMELLYLPVPPQTRNAVKGFIDMFVDRLGRAMGGLLLLLLTAGLSFSITSLSVVMSVVLVVWIAIAIVVKREYLHSFRLALEKKTIEPEALQVRVLDNSTVHALLAALSSHDERHVLYALDLLSTMRSDRWRSHLRALIQHPSPEVRARTIAVLAQWNDPLVTMHDFINHPDYETARVAAASALTFQWTGSPRSCEFLEQLLKDRSPEVVRQAIRTAGNVKYEDAIPALIEKLADKHLRHEAREALLQFEDIVIPDLLRRLDDGREPLAVRARVPKVLAFTGKQRAADALIDCLRRPKHDLYQRVLKALNRLRVHSSDLLFDEEVVLASIRREQDEHDRLCCIRDWLQDHRIEDPAFNLLIRAIRERLDQKVERVFRLIALIRPPNDIYSAYYSCKVKPELRASAVEFLDNLLDADLKTIVMPLIEEVPAAERIEFISLEAALQRLLAGDDTWLRAIANEVLDRLRKGEADEQLINVYGRIESRR